MANLASLPNRLDDESCVCRAIIETPKGCRNKFNYDPDFALFMLGGLLPEGMMFPFDFGFIPSTYRTGWRPSRRNGLDGCPCPRGLSHRGSHHRCHHGGTDSGRGKPKLTTGCWAWRSTPTITRILNSIGEVSKTLLASISTPNNSDNTIGVLGDEITTHANWMISFLPPNQGIGVG